VSLRSNPIFTSLEPTSPSPSAAARVEPVTALIADDDRGTLAILEATLRRQGLDVVSARDGAAAWDLLRQKPGISVAIVDWMMPGIDGLELCRRIRQEPTLAKVYVIVLTARQERGDLVNGLEAGADDYVIKPFDLDELRARVRVGVRLATLQDRLAAKIVELEATRDALERLASSDALTNLCSRRRWYELATLEVERFQRYRRPVSVLVADLDHFKRVNDTFGHAAGDEVLKAFAQLLRDNSRKSDVIGRLGGEEFAILMPETPREAAHEVAQRIVSGCRSVTASGPASPVKFTCSIGVAEAQPGDNSIETVLAHADAALYDAKRDGRDRVALAPALLP
jgi:two-component system, cell cycle response regulator